MNAVASKQQRGQGGAQGYQHSLHHRIPFHVHGGGKIPKTIFLRSGFFLRAIACGQSWRHHQSVMLAEALPHGRHVNEMRGTESSPTNPADSWKNTADFKERKLSPEICGRCSEPCWRTWLSRQGRHFRMRRDHETGRSTWRTRRAPGFSQDALVSSNNQRCPQAFVDSTHGFVGQLADHVLQAVVTHH